MSSRDTPQDVPRWLSLTGRASGPNPRTRGYQPGPCIADMLAAAHPVAGGNHQVVTRLQDLAHWRSELTLVRQDHQP